MSTKKVIQPKGKINFYFSKAKRSREETPAANFFAKRLRRECEILSNSQVEKDDEHFEHLSEDHSECVKKIKQLQKQVEDLSTKNRDLEIRNNTLQKDCKHLKKLFDESNKINLQKDIRINSILNEKSNSEESQSMFNNFKIYFTDNELRDLRSIQIRSPGDSTFIINCLRMLYKQNLQMLAYRTAEISLENKQPITPSKKKIISNIYKERLLYVPSSEFQWRLKKLNAHIKSGIRNIVRSKTYIETTDEQV